MKKSETQEQEFLEVCSSYDHDLLTGKREMTLKDYERITYLVSSLGYSQYLQFLIENIWTYHKLMKNEKKENMKYIWNIQSIMRTRGFWKKKKNGWKNF